MASILKVWLRFPQDAEDSYTSLPLSSDTTGTELASRISQAIKKKRGLSIDVQGVVASNEPGQELVWQMACKGSGAIINTQEKVLSQLNQANEKELRLVLAPESNIPNFTVGQCVYEPAGWCPAQAFVTYLVSSGQLPLAEGQAFSRRCFEENITGLQECLAGLTENEADLEALRSTIGADRHALVMQTVADIKAGTQCDALKAFLKPAKRPGRMRSIIVSDSNQVVARVHAVPKASISHDNRIPQPTAASSSNAASSSSVTAASSSPAAAPAPSPSTAPSLVSTKPFPSPAATKPYPVPSPSPPSAAASSSSSAAPIKRDSDSTPATGPIPSSSPPPLPISNSSPPTAALLATAATSSGSDSIVPASAVSMVTPVSSAGGSGSYAASSSSSTSAVPSGSGTGSKVGSFSNASGGGSVLPLPPPPPPPPAGSSSTSTLSKPPPGKLVEVVVDSGVLVERVQEWPTVVYDVVKINERGRRQNRILRLTSTHIQNIKGTDTISSRHSYDEVFCVTLSDHETLVISYLESHDYTYVSPVALQIVGDINERISKKREKQKSILSINLNAMALKFQEKMYKREQQSLLRAKGAFGGSSIIGSYGTQGLLGGAGGGANSVAASAPPSVSHLHPELASDLALLAVHDNNASNSTNNNSSGGGSSVDSPEKIVPSTGGQSVTSSSSAPLKSPPSRAPPPLLAKTVPSKSTLKLQQLFGSTSDQRLQVAIDTIVLDGQNDAGRARARFLKNFDALEKNPGTILQVIRQFMDSLRNFVETKRSEEIKKVTGLTLSPSSDPEEESLTSRIERSVEGGVVQPVYQRLITVLKKSSAAVEEQLSAQMHLLRTKVGCDQNFYGITNENHNVNNWSSAIEELNDMDKKLLPCEKLKCLLSTAKTIYTTFNHDRETRTKLAGYAPKPGQYFLSADDFFPIFTFCVAQSSLQYLDTTKSFLWGLCEKNALNGEGGYYLTVLEAAIEYLKTVVIPTK